MPFWGIYDEQRRKETRIFSRIFSNARGVRYDRRGVACNTQYLTDKLVFIEVRFDKIVCFFRGVEDVAPYKYSVFVSVMSL